MGNLTENIIEIDGLSYSFDGKKKVLDNVSFHMPKGAIYGFLGANGAGKSTTMRLIMGLYNDEKNSIKVFDQSVSKLYPEGLHRIGSLIDYPAFYSHLTQLGNNDMSSF